jgi:hypothetical protein
MGAESGWRSRFVQADGDSIALTGITGVIRMPTTSAAGILARTHQQTPIRHPISYHADNERFNRKRA